VISIFLGCWIYMSLPNPNGISEWSNWKCSPMCVFSELAEWNCEGSPLRLVARARSGLRKDLHFVLTAHSTEEGRSAGAEFGQPLNAERLRAHTVTRF
jgi:hypothetical protein